MSLTQNQVQSLIRMIVAARPDELDCDGCFDLISEFADARRENRPLHEKLLLVERHLTQCPCCAYEYEALIEAIHAMEDIA